MTEYTATYSPEDNKLRLYAVSRLDSETYARVKTAGFIWAPQQKLFVAPMWTPDREDLLLELAGEIGDEDTSLVDRAEERADRFEGYRDARAQDAKDAHAAVDRICDGIPLGQPILVGHHSERHARRDAEKIEAGMRKAVKMWDTSQYWQQRAKGAIRHAKYKERPDVRARRIKGIEADKRKQERIKTEAETCLKIWTKEGLTHEQALLFAGHTAAGYLHLPKKDGDKPDFSGQCSAYDALTGNYPNLYAPRTLDEIIAQAERVYPARMAHCDRWIQHCEHRLEYERAMLEADGASNLLDKKPRPPQLPLCNYRMAEGLDIENTYHRGEYIHYPQVEMTAAEYARIPTDYKATRVVDNSHRVRTAMQRSSLVCVFLTDSKIHERPAPVERKPILREVRSYNPPPPPTPEAEQFQAMRQTLKAGVQVVTAPQLFPTPPELAARMVDAAELAPEHRILEPSGGTARIILAIQDRIGKAADLVAVEIKPHLADMIRSAYRVPTYCADFLKCNGALGKFDRILMNPPFENGADIKHIEHALGMLNPGGRLVAICANGPRQNDRLRDRAATWEELPEGTFSGTGVRAVLLTIER